MGGSNGITDVLSFSLKFFKKSDETFKCLDIYCDHKMPYGGDNSLGVDLECMYTSVDVWHFNELPFLPLSSINSLPQQYWFLVNE